METSQVETHTNIESIVERLQAHETLKDKICPPRGNGIEIIVGTRANMSIVMSIFINNKVITSFLRFEEAHMKTDHESNLHNYKQYRNISELQQEIDRLLKEFQINN